MLAEDAAQDDTYGYSVAISGNYAVVSASMEDGVDAPNAGAAYIIVRTEDGWIQQKIVASDPEANDFFGYDVDITKILRQYAHIVRILVLSKMWVLPMFSKKQTINIGYRFKNYCRINLNNEVSPEVEVVFPTKIEIFAIGDEVTIEWIASDANNITGAPGAIQKSEVQYSVDGGTEWIDISTTYGNDYDLQWTIPDLYSPFCKI